MKIIIDFVLDVIIVYNIVDKNVQLIKEYSDLIDIILGIEEFIGSKVLFVL